MELSALAVFAAALLINSGTPGPSIAALVGRVIARGSKDVWPFLAAMWIGEGLWLAAAVLGLAVIAESFHAAFIVIKYCGVAYLAYLAWQMWCKSGDEGTEKLSTSGKPAQMFFAGMALTLGNPKIMLFYLSLLPSIVPIQDIGLAGLAALMAAMAAVLISVDLTWVMLAAGARGLFRSRRGLKIANRCGAAAMGGAAAAIAARSNG